MQVISGRYGNEIIHYEASPSADVPQMMNAFIEWLHEDHKIDSILIAAIARNRKSYYDILEKTQKGNLDITEWLIWFLERLNDAIQRAISLTDMLIVNC